jgi:hypothetical protein
MPMLVQAGRRRWLALSALLAMAFFAGGEAALADPAASPPHACGATTAQQAAPLAEKLFAAGQYQQAGECYQAAGDMTHANLAFLKAAGPKGADTARDLKAQGDTAKALFANAAQAFRRNH